MRTASPLPYFLGLFFHFLAASLSDRSSHAATSDDTVEDLRILQRTTQSAARSPLGSDMQSGCPAELAVTLHLRTPTYVYVIHEDAVRGEHKTLWPTQQPETPLFGSAVRVPPEDSWIKRPALRDSDRLCVIGSPTPLPPQQQVCKLDRADRKKRAAASSVTPLPSRQEAAASPMETAPAPSSNAAAARESLRYPQLTLALDWWKDKAAPATPTPDAGSGDGLTAPEQQLVSECLKEMDAPTCTKALEILKALEDKQPSSELRLVPVLIALARRQKPSLLCGQDEYYTQRHENLAAALRIVEKVRGPKSPVALEILEGLAQSYYLEGLHPVHRSKARAHYEELYRRYKAQLPSKERDASLQRCADMLVKLYQELGQYDKAVTYLKASGIERSKRLPIDPGTRDWVTKNKQRSELELWLSSVNHLWQKAAPQQAEKLLRAALEATQALRAEDLDKEAPEKDREARLLSIGRILFANVLRDSGLDRNKVRANEELRALRAALPSPRTTESEVTLALLSALLDLSWPNTGSAAALARTALTTHEEELKRSHPELRSALHLILAYQARANGAWSSEEKLLETAMQSPGSPSWVLDAMPAEMSRPSLNRIELQILRGQLEEAANALDDEVVAANAELDGVVVSAQAQQIRRSQKLFEDLVYGLVVRNPKNRLALLNAMALTIGRQAIGTELEQRAHQSLRELYKNSAQRGVLQKWEALISQREHLLWVGGEKTELASLEREAARLKAELLSGMPELPGETSVDDPTARLDRLISDVAGELRKAGPDGATLYSVVKVNPLTKKQNTPSLYEAEIYLALTLQADGVIRAHEVGTVAEIDRQNAELLQILPRARDFIPADRSPEKLGAALYQKLFQPLPDESLRPPRIYLSIEGPLQLLPFAALHDGTDYLVGKKEFVYLSAGRDLLRRVDLKPAHRPAAIIADPQLTGPRAQKPRAATSGRATERAADKTSEKNAERFVGLLPASMPPGLSNAGLEVEAVKTALALRSNVYANHDATEDRIRATRDPSILHIVSHGTFIPGQSESDSLLSHSALYLAGAFDRNSKRSGDRDGILTANEAQRLELSGTKLVVLSACETAQGVVLDGEGVYGMHRAFLLAGAETVVASAWQVDDGAAKKLMARFYRFLRETPGRDRVTALFLAMRELRSLGAYSEPRMWAPFILIGRDGPFELDASLALAKP